MNNKFNWKKLFKIILVEFLFYFSGVLSTYYKYEHQYWMFAIAVILLLFGSKYFDKWFKLKENGSKS